MPCSRMLCSAAVGFALAAFLSVPGRAEGVTVGAPITHGGLTLYPIHAAPQPGPKIAVLDGTGAAQNAMLRWTDDGVTIQNMSATPLLVPLGALLLGGAQDQVVGASVVLPPHSSIVDLTTFCVDPFRNAPRTGDSGELMRDVGTRMPSQTAQLSLLSGATTAPVIDRIRQRGVWWSVDALQEQLTARTGHALTSPDKATAPLFAQTALDGRTSNWLDGLPLALEDTDLVHMEASVVSAFDALPGSGADIVGVAAAIGGHWVGAEIEASHEVFRSAFPSIVRGFALESLAEHASQGSPHPSAAEMEVLLRNAGEHVAHRRALGDMTVVETMGVITASISYRGRPVSTVYLPKLDPAAAATSPARLVVAMLETGKIGATPLERLDATPVLSRVTEHDDQGHPIQLWQAAPKSAATIVDGPAPEVPDGIDFLLMTAGGAGLIAIMLAVWVLVRQVLKASIAAMASLRIGSKLGWGWARCWNAI